MKKKFKKYIENTWVVKVVSGFLLALVIYAAVTYPDLTIIEEVVIMELIIFWSLIFLFVPNSCYKWFIGEPDD